MKKTNLFEQPFWIFWIGLLTGALIIGLIFSYQAIQSQNLRDAFLIKSYEKSLTPVMSSSEWEQGN